MSRVFEIGGGRSGTVTDIGTRSRTFCAIDYDDEETACAAVYSYLTTASLVTIGSTSVSNMQGREIEGQDDRWIVTVDWASFRPKEPTAADNEFSPPEFNFEYSLSPEKIYVPIGSQSIYKRTTDTSATPEIALIGDQGDGQPPEGVDLLLPTISQSETRFIKQSALSETDRNNLLRLLGKVNTTTFRGWDAGEVLFSGVSGRARGRDDWELNFRFLIRQNTTISVPGFTAIDKLGWEYLWPRYKLQRDDTNTLKRSQMIEYLILSQVYETTAFTSLE